MKNKNEKKFMAAMFAEKVKSCLFEIELFKNKKENVLFEDGKTLLFTAAKKDLKNFSGKTLKVFYAHDLDVICILDEKNKKHFLKVELPKRVIEIKVFQAVTFEKQKHIILFVDSLGDKSIILKNMTTNEFVQVTSEDLSEENIIK